MSTTLCRSHQLSFIIYIIMKKQSKHNKCGNKCQLHGFSLKPIQEEVYYKKNTITNFCKQKKQNSLQYVYPEFNKDNLYYTPAFILSVDKLYYKQNDIKIRKQHEQKVREQTQSTKIIYEPKPGRKYKYCAVCRINYQDYLQHIRSGTHKKNISLSKYNSLILDTCKSLFGNELKQKQINSIPKYKTQQHKKIQAICIDDDEDDYEPPILKKMKTQEPQKVSETSTKTNNNGVFPIQNQFYYWNFINNNFFNQYHTGMNQKSMINNVSNSPYFSQPYCTNLDRQYYLTHYQYQYQLQKYQQALSRYNSLQGIMIERPIVIQEDD